jgi:shikimate kinase
MLLFKTVVLIGMMGSGKTSVGKVLSTALDVPLADTDAEISKDANSTISEIFDRDGEAKFRQAETRVIKRLLQGAPCVVSTGGGAFLNKENRKIIAKFGVSVLLEVDRELLWERVRRKNTRPLLKTTSPRETLFKILDSRQDTYNLSDFTVQSDKESTIAQTANAVIDLLVKRPDVLNPMGD